MTSLPGLGAYGTTAADLNDDGFVDLVICGTGKPDERGTYLYWGSPGGFSTQRRETLPVETSYTSSAADVNRDGYLDLVFCGMSAGKPVARVLPGSARGFAGRGEDHVVPPDQAEPDAPSRRREPRRVPGLDRQRRLRRAGADLLGRPRRLCGVSHVVRGGRGRQQSRAGRPQRRWLSRLHPRGDVRPEATELQRAQHDLLGDSAGSPFPRASGGAGIVRRGWSVPSRT